MSPETAGQSGAKRQEHPAWATTRALGYVSASPIRRATLDAGRPLTVPLTLTPDPRGCASVDAGRCTAGCFEVMAIAPDHQVDLSVTVSPAGAPEDIIAASLHPGSVVTGGLCYQYPLGHSGVQSIDVRIEAQGDVPEGSPTELPIELAAWRHRDPRGGLEPPSPSLRLPPLGTPLSELLSQDSACAKTWDQERTACHFHGSIGMPLSEQCDNGCTWWTYRFDRNGDLDGVELRRSVVDVDEAFVGRFADEAALVAGAIDLQVGTIAPSEDLGAWTEVEHPRAGAEARVELARRTWTLHETTIRWELAGIIGHHPSVELLLDVSRSSPPLI